MPRNGVHFKRRRIAELMKEVYCEGKRQMGMWKVKPNDWPAQVPFGDPNNEKSLKEKQLNDMLNFLCWKRDPRHGADQCVFMPHDITTMSENPEPKNAEHAVNVHGQENILPGQNQVCHEHPATQLHATDNASVDQEIQSLTQPMQASECQMKEEHSCCAKPMSQEEMDEAFDKFDEPNQLITGACLLQSLSYDWVEEYFYKLSQTDTNPADLPTQAALMGFHGHNASQVLTRDIATLHPDRPSFAQPVQASESWNMNDHNYCRKPNAEVKEVVELLRAANESPSRRDTEYLCKKSETYTKHADLLDLREVTLHGTCLESHITLDHHDVG